MSWSKLIVGAVVAGLVAAAALLGWDMLKRAEERRRIERETAQLEADTRIDITKAQIQSIDKAMQAFKVDLKRWPTHEEGLAVLWNKDGIQDAAERSRWRYAYLDKPITADPWGTPLIYTPSRTVSSAGPDRQHGTADDISFQSNDESGGFDDFRPASISPAR